MKGNHYMELINKYLLMAISLGISVTYVTIRNLFCKKYVKGDIDFYAFNFLSSVISFLILIVAAGGMIKPSIFTLLLGIVFGVFTALSSIFSMSALRIGPISYTMVITSSALIIPSLSGKLFWNEPVMLLQYVGIVLMIISISMSIPKEQNKEKRASSLKWLVLCLLTFATTGGIGVMQKFHQNSEHKNELSEFLIIAFIFSAIYSLVMYLFMLKKSQKSGFYEKTTFGIIHYSIAILSGVFIALLNLFNLYLTGVIPSIIFFPVFDGGKLVITTIIAITFFKEKLTKKQWIGISIGFIAIFLLCNIIPMPF